MNRSASPSTWLSILGSAFVMAASLSTGTGCSALGAAANPKVAWAITDPAPMSVVVRRADAATATSKEVDRLLTATPASPDSDWIGNVAPSKDDAKADVNAVGALPMYAQTKARVVPAEVWVRTLPNLKCDSGQYPSLLAFVDPTLADAYAKIMAKKQEVADLKSEKADEEKAADAKDVTPDDKKAHQDKASALDKQIDTEDDKVEPMQKDFVKSAKDKAAAASADMKAKLGPAMANLRHAVEDAQLANSAAAVRYPMAIPGIQGAVKGQVSVIVADIIEEKTGKRPNMASLQPNITFDGSGIDLTINGLSKDDLGQLSMGDVVSETVKRTKDWMGHALGLLGDIAKNKDILGFEADVLDAVLDGFKSSGGWTPPATAAIDTTVTPGAGAVSATSTTSATAAANGKTSAATQAASSSAPTAKPAALKTKAPQAKKKK